MQQYFLNLKAIANKQFDIPFGKIWQWKGTRYELGSLQL